MCCPTLEHFGIHLWVLWNQLSDDGAAGRVVRLSDAEQQLILAVGTRYSTMTGCYGDGWRFACVQHSGSLNAGSISYTVQLDQSSWQCMSPLCRAFQPFFFHLDTGMFPLITSTRELGNHFPSKAVWQRNFGAIKDIPWTSNHDIFFGYRSSEILHIAIGTQRLFGAIDPVTNSQLPTHSPWGSPAEKKSQDSSSSLGHNQPPAGMERQ